MLSNNISDVENHIHDAVFQLGVENFLHNFLNLILYALKSC